MVYDQGRQSRAPAVVTSHSLLQIKKPAPNMPLRLPKTPHFSPITSKLPATRTHRHRPNLPPPRMRLDQPPLRNLPRLTDHMRDPVQIEPRMHAWGVVVVVVGVARCTDIDESRCRWAGRPAAMRQVLDQLRSEQRVSYISTTLRTVPTAGLFSAATLSSTKKTTPLNRSSGTSGGVIVSLVFPLQTWRAAETVLREA